MQLLFGSSAIDPDPKQEGAFYDSGDVTSNTTFNPVRDIDWESNVFLTSGPAPRLVIDAAGHVTQATNISYTELAGEFLVNSITFNDQGTAHFFTNDVVGGAPGKGRIAGDQSTFSFQENFNVTILNASAKNVEVLSIDPNNRLTSPEVTIDVPNDGGFSFNVGQTYTSARIDVESTGRGTGADTLVAGVINNPLHHPAGRRHRRRAGEQRKRVGPAPTSFRLKPEGTLGSPTSASRSSLSKRRPTDGYVDRGRQGRLHQLARAPTYNRRDDVHGQWWHH